MEWIHDEYSVVEKHAQTMLQLVKFGIDWKCGELEQIVNIPVRQIVEEITEVNIPVTQIVEEIADREYSSYTECGRNHRLWKVNREYSSYKRLWKKRSQR